jgi:hypothetical protein
MQCHAQSRKFFDGKGLAATATIDMRLRERRIQM